MSSAGGRKRKPSSTDRYTAEQKAEALRILLADGLPAAAAHVGAAKSTVTRWAKVAGIAPEQYAQRSADQNREAARASAAARRAGMVERRQSVSDDLIGRLTPRAIELLLGRLDEEVELRSLLDEDERRLEEAIVALEALGAPDDPRDPATDVERKVKKAMRADAREAVRDARLILGVHRSARIDVRALVGIMTRGVTDHLNLEGDLTVDATGAGAFAVVFSHTRPDRSARPEPVTLPATTEAAR